MGRTIDAPDGLGYPLCTLHSLAGLAELGRFPPTDEPCLLLRVSRSHTSDRLGRLLPSHRILTGDHKIVISGIGLFHLVPDPIAFHPTFLGCGIGVQNGGLAYARDVVQENYK